MGERYDRELNVILKEEIEEKSKNETSGVEWIGVEWSGVERGEVK